MDIAAFTELFGRERACAILRTDSQDRAAQAMDAAIRGGFRVIEFTLAIPGALELIRDFSARPGIVVGAGTVLGVDQAEDAVAAGARYLVSPVTDAAVIRAAQRLGVASMPGTHTPSEMLTAHRAGATLCKLFPAPPGGPAYVRSILAPVPFLKIVPTNGVDHRNARDWLHAGSFAVGFVATLFEQDWLVGRQWDAIEERARACLRAVQST